MKKRAIVLVWRGFIRIRLKDYEGAVDDLTKAIELKQDLVDDNSGIAGIYDDRGSPKESFLGLESQAIRPSFGATAAELG